MVLFFNSLTHLIALIGEFNTLTLKVFIDRQGLPRAISLFSGCRIGSFLLWGQWICALGKPDYMLNFYFLDKQSLINLFNLWMTTGARHGSRCWYSMGACIPIGRQVAHNKTFVQHFKVYNILSQTLSQFSLLSCDNCTLVIPILKIKTQRG